MSTLDGTKEDRSLSRGEIVVTGSTTKGTSSSETYAVAGNIDDLERHFFGLSQMGSEYRYLSGV